PGYDLSGIGNSVLVTGGSGSRQDENITYTEQTSGAVYAAFMVNVASADTNGDYFFHLGPEILGASYRGRVFVKDDGSGNFLFGLSKSGGSGSEPPVFTSTTYSYGSTYLLVLKYEFVDTLAYDDTVRLYINPDLNAAEPVNADLVNSDTSANGVDRAMGCVALRQGANNYEISVDGIRITTTWETAVPVELTSFSAIANKNSVNLSWKTASETNNHGFELFRNGKMISFIPGAGTTTEERSYSYLDKNLASKTYIYKLIQVDLDGTRETVAQQEVNINSAPTKFELSQNYPNPFNPSTKIKYSIPFAGTAGEGVFTSLKIYNILGSEVTSLVNEKKEAGNYEVEFKANNFPSGVYFYSISAGNFHQTKKMILTK
ncbi:MAG: T9SS type A sorting domain-containing protein, partial [Ignavibacteriaceae bacterium]